jgi:hypothetical protein
MAESEEAKGLKIAVSALVTLSVILGVSLYLLYTAYTKSQEQLLASRRQVELLTKQITRSNGHGK